MEVHMNSRREMLCFAPPGVHLRGRRKAAISVRSTETDRAIEILHEDPFLLAANKPGGMLMHRNLKLTRGKEEKYFVDELKRQRDDKEIYPVHRLDRATSGVVLFARSSEGAKKLQATMSADETVKEYIALVRGFTDEEWTNDHALTDHNSSSRVRREARTEFKKLMTLPDSRLSLLRAIPRTGRQNQIRRHLSSDRHHIIGDVKFGKGKDNTFFRNRYGLPRLFLHARRLSIRHPETGESMTLEAALPPELYRFLCNLPDFSSIMHSGTADTGIESHM